VKVCCVKVFDADMQPFRERQKRGEFAMTEFISIENATDELNATGTFDEASDSYVVFGIQVAAVTISAVKADAIGYVSDFSNVPSTFKKIVKVLTKSIQA
jgi:hypothetical protein